MSKDEKRPCKTPIPYDKDLLDQFFSPILKDSKLRIKPGHRITHKISGHNPYVEVSVSFVGAGRNKSPADPEVIQLVEECIKAKEIKTHDRGLYKFITTSGNNIGKIKHTTVAEYIFHHTSFGRNFSDDRQIRREVKKALPEIKQVKKEGNIFKIRT